MVAFMEFIFKRLQGRNSDGSLQIMYTIHGSSPYRYISAFNRLKQTLIVGEKELEEIELTHLDGHKGSKPVR